MAYAAYRELLGATLASVHARDSRDSHSSRDLRPHAGSTWMVLDVTVHGCDAFKVRHALGTCADCAVLRCVPDGELGHLMSWACHLQRQSQGRTRGVGRGHGV